MFVGQVELGVIHITVKMVVMFLGNMAKKK